MRLTARGRAVLAVVLVGLVAAGALLLFRPWPTGAPPPDEPPSAAGTPTATTAATVPTDPGGGTARPVVAWAALDEGSGEYQVYVERGEGLEVVYVATETYVRPVGWFGTDVPDRLVLLAGQDLFDLLVVDLSTGGETPLDPRPAQDAWTEANGDVVAVLVGDEGGYRQIRWDATGAVVADDEVAEEVPEHETPGAAATPPATLQPAPGFEVEWAGTADSSTLSIDGRAAAEGRLTAVLVWPPAEAPRGP